MAQVQQAPYTYRPLAFGAVGGFFAAAVALVVLVALGVARGLAVPVAPNAIGAWFVRWLQTAMPSALDGFYPDATLGGGVVFLLVGASVGALFAALLDRLPEDHPVAWGMVLGLGLWVLTRWAIAPALDPVLVRVLPQGVLLATDLVFGLLLGVWVHAGRRAGW